MCELEGGDISTALPRKSIDSILRKEFKALSYSWEPGLYVVPLNVQPTEEQLLHATSKRVDRYQRRYDSMFGNNPLETLVGPAKLMLDRSLDAIGFHGTQKVMATLWLLVYGVKVDGDVKVGDYRNKTLIWVAANFCPAGEDLSSKLVQTPEQTEAVHDFATSLRTRIEEANTAPAYAAR